MREVTDGSWDIDIDMSHVNGIAIQEKWKQNRKLNYGDYARYEAVEDKDGNFFTESGI